MRIREALMAAAAALVLAGCGGPSGTGSDESSVEQPRLKGLRVEVEAQTHDPCFREPAELAPADCQKYITQLTSTPESANMISQADPALRKAADKLDNAITAYRGNGCAGVKEESEKCTEALVTVAEALRTMNRVLDTGTG